jgi:hypothetical protein
LFFKTLFSYPNEFSCLSRSPVLFHVSTPFKGISTCKDAFTKYTAKMTSHLFRLPALLLLSLGSHCHLLSNLPK